MPVLLVERGNDKGLTLKVEAGKTYVVGRENEKAAFQLNDAMASRAHFQIAALNGSFRIKDMKSRNGTKLNDEKLAPDADQEIKVGDKIQVGETIFSFLSDEKEESTGGGLNGKTIGGYKILERVGRGGMGTVYKAEQISLNRIVALKVLSAKLLSDPVFVEKFVAEAKAAGGLTHPNIVQVIDVGSDRGIYFFSMEYLDNGSVGDVATKEGKVPWERALEMLTDAARGLIFAEKRGIVHRDIKPDNLMLTSEGAVKIGDLGLAKKAEDLGGEGGQIFGTPHFIAPEQAQGKPVDNRADLYALGATFYRVLAGKTPFSGDNVKEILLQQIQKEPEPLVKLVPDMPEEIGAVIGKLMKKKADDRYRSAQGLLEDLERIRVKYHLAAHGIAASAQRNKWIAIGLALAVCGLGYGVYFYAMKPPETHTVYQKDPNQRDPVNTNTGPTITPEMQAVLDFDPLGKEQQGLEKSLGGDPAATWRGHEAEWLALAEKLEQFAGSHGGTPKAAEAKKSATEIRTAIEKAKAAWTEKNDKLNRDWNEAIAAMKASATEGKFNEAVEKQAAAEKILKKENLEFLPPTAPRDLQKLLGEIVDGAEKAMAPLLASVGTTSKEFPGAHYIDAREGLEAVRKGIAPAGAARDASTASLAGFAKQIDDALASTRSAAEDATRDALDDDLDAWVNAYLAIRRLVPEEPEGAAAFVETPFFDYRWDDALARWEALRKVLRTKPFQDKAALKITVYKRCKRLFETIAAKVRSREIRDPDFPEFIRKRATVALDAQKRDKATPEGVHIVRGQNQAKEFLPFRAFTPRELYESFLKKTDGVPFSAEDHVDLSCFLMEAGCGEIANMELNVGIMGTNPTTIEPALASWLKLEYTAYLEFNLPGGPLALFDRYRAAKTQLARKEALEKMRQEIEEKIREIQAKESFWITDFSLLHFSQNGPEGPHPERVLPAKDVDDFLETLGVPGGKRLPPAQKSPVPPTNGHDGTTPPPPPSGGDGTGTGGESPAPPPPPK